MNRFRSLLSAVALAAISAAAGPATKSATINAQGPRTGGSGGAYLNAEGTGTGKYACYGVADFGKLTAGKAHKLKLTLTQSDAAFTKDGPIAFYICDGAAPIGTGSPLKFNEKTPNTFGAESMHLVLLGKGDFKKTANGKADSFVFPISGGVAKLLKTSQNVRIVLEPAGPTVAATYAGAENKTLKHPQLDLVP